MIIYVRIFQRPILCPVLSCTVEKKLSRYMHACSQHAVNTVLDTLKERNL